ncbi:MAG: hypothetical protein IJ153_06975 [Clostridia bacterium]|nr:hypothetical protein [Clostridia bacterium]
MKFTFIGQDIAMLLPTLLTDLLFAGKEREAEIVLEEKNPAMAELLTGYGEAILKKAKLGGRISATGNREEALRGADCVVYAGDPQAASRFFMDRAALESGNEQDPEDPGLTDQARVNGGIEGLLHTLRAGQAVLELCDAMEEACPETLVINLGQPIARTTEIFLRRGFRCYGIGRTPLKGANGLDTLTRRLQAKESDLDWEIAGLPGFSFLMKLVDRESGKDWLPRLKKAARENELGQLTKRWLDWWDAIAVGDVTDHAEFLPAQPDYIPEEKPEFGETVEKRKERILYMNTVRDQGADATEGAMAQLLLLSRVPPVRPMRVALALLRGEDAVLPAVAHRNGGDMPQLPPEAMVETSLRVQAGEMVPQGYRVTPALAEVMTEIDEANRLAARAAMGDREALRECVEMDPALSGLDRLYCMDVVNHLIDMHLDMLPLFAD